MHNTIPVHNNPMPLVEFQGQRVVTFAMVDEAHQRPKGTAKVTFSRNRPRFIESEDFFIVAASTVDWGSAGHLARGIKHTGKKVTNLAWDMKRPGKRMSSAICGKVTLITESGFTLAVKLSKLDMRSRSAGGPAARKKGSTANAAPWCRVNQSLGFLRCSAFSLRPQASSTQEEKLAPEFSSFSLSMLASISSMSSCGNRMPLYEDLLFLCPVAITATCLVVPISGDNTSTIKTSEVFKHKMIDVFKHHAIRYLNTLSTGKAQSVHKIATPRSAGTLPRRLTTTDRFCIEAAMKNHTTAPQRFTFLFLAVVRANPQAHPHREQITAISEREARSLLAGRFVLVFAGRLPVLGGSHA